MDSLNNFKKEVYNMVTLFQLRLVSLIPAKDKAVGGYCLSDKLNGPTGDT